LYKVCKGLILVISFEKLMYTRSTMPDLSYRLSAHDLGYLRIVADLWGLETSMPDSHTAVTNLTRIMKNPSHLQEIVNALPDEARDALDTLIKNKGMMTWARFTHLFGQLREMGPGKRDREKPYLDPISSTEVLWYRAIIGRDFLRRSGELQECVYIPDDLLALMPSVPGAELQPPGRAASPGETSFIQTVSDRILDHTCTLLAALRMEDPKRSPAWSAWSPPFEAVHALLGAMKLITSSEQPVPEDARPFLEMPRGESLAWLVRGWRESGLFNELRLIPNLVCEGTWVNDPRMAREKILNYLSEIPTGSWWHLDAFIQGIYEREPDFQRPAGDFDTWLIRDRRSGESLSGIKNWDAVDGALIRYMITGPMHWLGLIDLASRHSGEDVLAFRFSDWSEHLLMGQPPDGLPVEDQPVESFSNGRLIASTYTARLARYQVSRFCQWTKETETQYVYQLTSSSLAEAGKQGLKVAHLELLLNKYGEATPPNLIQALRQWDQKGGQARIHSAVILRVDNQKILQALRESPAARFLGDSLGPTTAIIHPDAVQKVVSALAKLGYLADYNLFELEMDDSEEL
jgi:hypothetical protein